MIYGQKSSVEWGVKIDASIQNPKPNKGRDNWTVLHHNRVYNRVSYLRALYFHEKASSQFTLDHVWKEERWF